MASRSLSQTQWAQAWESILLISVHVGKEGLELAVSASARVRVSLFSLRLVFCTDPAEASRKNNFVQSPPGLLTNAWKRGSQDDCWPSAGAARLLLTSNTVAFETRSQFSSASCWGLCLCAVSRFMRQQKPLCRNENNRSACSASLTGVHLSVEQAAAYWNFDFAV